MFVCLPPVKLCAHGHAVILCPLRCGGSLLGIQVVVKIVDHWDDLVECRLLISRHDFRQEEDLFHDWDDGLNDVKGLVRRDLLLQILVSLVLVFKSPLLETLQNWLHVRDGPDEEQGGVPPCVHISDDLVEPDLLLSSTTENENEQNKL